MKEALERMKIALANAQTNLQKAQERMKRVEDGRRRSERYMVIFAIIARIFTEDKGTLVGLLHHREISPVAHGLDLPPDW